LIMPQTSADSLFAARHRGRSISKAARHGN